MIGVLGLYYGPKPLSRIIAFLSGLKASEALFSSNFTSVEASQSGKGNLILCCSEHIFKLGDTLFPNTQFQGLFSVIGLLRMFFDSLDTLVEQGYLFSIKLS